MTRYGRLNVELTSTARIFLGIWYWEVGPYRKLLGGVKMLEAQIYILKH